MPLKTIRSLEPDAGGIAYFRRRISCWTPQTPEKFPWRTTRSKFHALIAEILLQRTRAEQVVAVYRKFASEFRSPRALAAASLPKIRRIISSLGLSWRALNIKKLGKVLVEKHRGKIPRRHAELIELPGVGPYAAAAFLSFHINRRALIVDSNIVRLLGRFFGFFTHPETRRDRRLANLVDRITPRVKSRAFNYSLLDFGRTICKTDPSCKECVLRRKCRVFNGG